MNWIDTKEKLPENQDMVIIFPQPDFDECGRIITAFYGQYDGGTNGVKKRNWYCFNHEGYHYKLERITHWMPFLTPDSKGATP